MRNKFNIKKLKCLLIIFIGLVTSLIMKADATNYIFESKNVSFNNSSNGIRSRNVQDAIDELYEAAVGDCYVGYEKGTTTATQYTCNRKAPLEESIINYDSIDVTYENDESGLQATNVQAAIQELASKISYCNDNYDKVNETSNSYDCQVLDFTVNYNYSENGGTSSTKTSDTVTYNTPVDLSVTAEKSGWTFVGWNTDQNATSALSSLDMGMKDITLYAIYRKEAIDKYVQFNKNGNASYTYNGTQYTADTSFTLCTIPAVYNNAVQDTSCTGTITLPTLEAASGFTTKGWHTSSGGTASPTYSSGQANVSLTTSGTYNLYGQSQKAGATRTVTYNSNGGSSVSSNSCTTAAVYNGASLGSCNVTLRGAPTKSLCTFKGWKSSANNSTYNASASVSISSNVTMTAQWNCATWHRYGYYSTGLCATKGSDGVVNCLRSCKTLSSSVVAWSCTNDGYGAPSSPNLSTGGQCWCAY